MTAPYARPAERPAGITPSRIRAVFDRAAELEAGGARVIHLEIGRPDFDTPQVVKNAAVAALAAGRVHYGPNAGAPQLREAIAEHLEASHRTRYDAHSQVLVTIGASEAVFLAVLAFCGPGDEVIIPVPAWPAYEACVRLAGATPVFLPLDPADGYVLDPSHVRRLLTPRTRMVVACTPHNPTGAVIGAARLADLAATVRGTRVLVLADEIYRELVYGDVRHVAVASVAGLGERTIAVGGFAKAYAMDGWRLGWLVGPRALVTPALRLRQFSTTCPPTFAQDAAVAALRDAGAEREQMRRAFAVRRQVALEMLDGQGVLWPGPPSGAFYLYLGYPRHLGPAEEFASRLLEEQRVAVVPGTAFDPTGGGQHRIRVSYATSLGDVREGMSHLLTHWRQLDEAARVHNRMIRISGATGAALPAGDLARAGLRGLGCVIIRACPNGTVTFVLDRLARGDTLQDAVREAQRRGITEADPSADLSGADAATKLRLLAALAWGWDPAVVRVDATPVDVAAADPARRAADRGHRLRAVAVARADRPAVVRVDLMETEPGDPLHALTGPEKAVVFGCPDVGDVVVSGGRSSPPGAALAMVKDAIDVTAPRVGFV